MRSISSPVVRAVRVIVTVRTSCKLKKMIITPSLLNKGRMKIAIKDGRKEETDKFNEIYTQTTWDVF